MMKICSINVYNNGFNLSPDLSAPKGRAIAIGNFDGVHKGHAQIIKQLKLFAEHNGLTASVLTFEPHPIAIFKPEIINYRITNPGQKAILLKKMEVDELFVAGFDEELSHVTARDFVEKLLLEKLDMKLLITGDDFHFGYKREGTPKLLSELSKELGFEYYLVGEVSNNDNTRYSSTIIRKLVAEGSVKQANELMDTPFKVSGKVLEGNKKGKTIGFPTANLAFEDNKLIPKFGVYKSYANVGYDRYESITNIGIRPTVDSNEQPNCETHIFGFDENIYGEYISVELVDYIRPEMKFGSLDELKKQISLDIEAAKKL